MRILGIDPGTQRTGWGVVDVEKQMFSAVDYGCITTSKRESLPKRLFLIYKNLSEILQKYNPEIIAVEEVFFAKNTKTAIDVGHARGVSLLLAGAFDIPLEELTPLQVKSFIVGYGNAEKEQVGIMVKSILGLGKVPRPDDTCDALAIAISAGIKRSFRAVILPRQKRISEKGTEQ